MRVAQVAGIALVRRSAKVVTLRMGANIFLSTNSCNPLLFKGDINDVPVAQTSLILWGRQRSEIGALDFNRPDKEGAMRLFNLASAIDPARRYFRVENGWRELLAQIFGSEEFFPGGPG